MVRLLLCIILLVPVAAQAEPYPAYQNIFLNDYAQVIPPEGRERLIAAMRSLKDRTGVEMTVITIPTRKDYDPSPSIESFALGLFNYWGVGGKERNDGILMLVAPSDREMRIQLGSAYDQGYDVVAQDIVNRTIEPAFAAGRYGEGIEAGLAEIIDRIAMKEPKAAPVPATAPETAGGSLVPWLVGGGMALMIGMAAFGRRLRDLSAVLKRCPQCGKRGLQVQRDTVMAATATATGLQRVQTECRNCGWRDSRSVTIPITARGGGSGGSFGGGKSSGGGATGRW